MTSKITFDLAQYAVPNHSTIIKSTAAPRFDGTSSGLTRKSIICSSISFRDNRNTLLMVDIREGTEITVGEFT